MKKLLILLLFPLMMFAQDSTLIGDVDCSGEVNSQDASLILQFVTNVIDSLPCEANMTGLTPDQLQEMIDMMDEQLSISYSTQTSGNGFDFWFPDGYSSNIIYNQELTYTVPLGNTLYITSLEGRWFASNSSVSGYDLVDRMGNQPVILPEGTEITVYSTQNSDFQDFL